MVTLSMVYAGMWTATHCTAVPVITTLIYCLHCSLMVTLILSMVYAGTWAATPVQLFQ